MFRDFAFLVCIILTGQLLQELAIRNSWTLAVQMLFAITCLACFAYGSLGSFVIRTSELRELVRSCRHENRTCKLDQQDEDRCHKP